MTATPSIEEAQLCRQLANLHRLGYPGLAGIDRSDLDALVSPLRAVLPSRGPAAESRIPLLLVVRNDLVPTVAAVERWQVEGKTGWTDMAAELSGYRPIDEGVALVTQFPDVFASRNAFQALASRADDRRVPSFWMSKGAPRLGWCWAGNPHSWLGSASAASRVAPPA